jgi:hypothetical protein
VEKLNTATVILSGNIGQGKGIIQGVHETADLCRTIHKCNLLYKDSSV